MDAAYHPGFYRLRVMWQMPVDKWKITFYKNLEFRSTVVTSDATTAVRKARAKLGLDNTWRKWGASKVG